MDNLLLKFNLNNPKKLSNIPKNVADTPHTPRGFQSYEREQASGQYKAKPFLKKLLKPAPRNQLNYPTQNRFHGLTAPYYKQVLGNGNFVRGNEFGLSYPFHSKPESTEIESPTLRQGREPLDYLNSDIVMRKRSPFFPYPNFDYTKNPDYQTYPHTRRYVKGQPIYNYPYGRQEGIPEGVYNPFLVENFGNRKCSMGKNNTAYVGLFLVIGILLLYTFRD